MTEPEEEPDTLKPLESSAKTADAFAKALQLVGDTGRWQWEMTFITAFCGVFTAMQNFGAVFLAAQPDHWCQIPELGYNASYSREMLNVTTPWVKGNEGQMVPSSCSYYSLGAEFVNGTKSEIKDCDAWFYDNSTFHSTVVSDWDLVCSRKWLMPTSQSTYMMGILAGAVFFSFLSDKFGRRPTSLAGVLLFIVSANAVPFCPNFTMFLLVRFLVAASGQGIFLVVFIILMETIGVGGRNKAGILFHYGFTAGFCAFAGIGYLIRDWRSLQIAISVPTVSLLLYWWLLPESPRWLMVEGRFSEAREILLQIAKKNKMPIPTEAELKSVEIVIRTTLYRPKSDQPKVSFKQKILNLYEDVATLVRTPNMRRRNCVMFYAWFVTSMLYYGLSFNGANLNAPIYVNVFLSGAVEIPGTIIIIVLTERFGRRFTLILIMLIGGVACTSIGFTPSRLVALNVTLSSLGKFAAGGSFCIIFMYSAELVPTSVRNISVGMASMWGRIGSAIAPYIVDLLGNVYYAIPSTVFGLVALLCAGLVLLLPETGKEKLPESIEEIEKCKR